VTVTADDNGEEPGTLTPDTETPVTGVRLDKQNLTVAAGAQEGLIAAVEPKEATNQAVTWTSNNESIATVDDQGVVTGKGVGTATITVKTNDGNKTAQCTVSVIPAGETTQAKITITGISAKYQGNNYYAKAFVFPDGTSLFDMVADSGILAGGSVELVSGSADIDLSEGMEKIPWFPKSGSSYAVFFMIRDDKDTLLYYAGEKKTVSFNNQAAASIAFSQFTDVTETLNEFIEEQKQE
ncbi:MAG: Ig-like domain-containing protein, partial [Treponema sp.]|nr:Ig-like domain-containing protein [Treponema sp.]